MSTPYVTLQQIKAALPAQITAQLLDDNSAGAPDVTLWPEIVAAVTREIDGKVGMRYPLPLAEPVPSLIASAAFVLAAELVYQRRNYHGAQNPWTERANGIRGTSGQQGGQAGLLDKIATGETPLLASMKAANHQASAITSTAKTTPTSGHMLC